MATSAPGAPSIDASDESIRWIGSAHSPATGNQSAARTHEAAERKAVRALCRCPPRSASRRSSALAVTIARNRFRGLSDVGAEAEEERCVLEPAPARSLPGRVGGEVPERSRFLMETLPLEHGHDHVRSDLGVLILVVTEAAEGIDDVRGPSSSEEVHPEGHIGEVAVRPAVHAERCRFAEGGPPEEHGARLADHVEVLLQGEVAEHETVDDRVLRVRRAHFWTIRQRLALRVDPPAAARRQHDIVGLEQRVEEPLDRVRLEEVVLHEVLHVRTRGEAQASLEVADRTEARLVPVDMDPGILGGERPGDLHRRVARAIVTDDDLESHVRLCHRRAKCVGDVALAVERRNQHADEAARRLRHGPRVISDGRTLVG